jgi:hypothetical protein
MNIFQKPLEIFSASNKMSLDNLGLINLLSLFYDRQWQNASVTIGLYFSGGRAC